MKKLIVCVAFLLTASACDSVSYVERITIVNPSDYSVLVDVKGADDTSWLPLGIANRNSESLNEQVIDMGEGNWIFRFRYLGEDLGEDTVSKSQLEKQRWQYTIPERVGELLKEKGYEPSYR